MRSFASLVFLLCCLVPAGASEPGQPLDCSDWVFLEPGYSCSLWAGDNDCVEDSHRLCIRGADLVRMDNESQMIAVRNNGAGPCPGGAINRLELVRFEGSTEQIVGYIEGRCNETQADQVSGHPDPDAGPTSVFLNHFTFDPLRGSVLIPLESDCQQQGSTFCEIGHYHTNWIAEITGFTPLFEVEQSYQVDVPAFSYRVPVRPEGFPAVDWFDAYYGQLPVDFTAAQGLDCGFPSSPPGVGDYLTVADTLPTPAPGNGFWYVTAVNYMGETRYGRQRIGGVLSGRDPGLLPGCVD